ncbi:hypothetical protein [Solimonas soli]|uniref:hypothetical protein n=1 Tax=Solimonas soli TaxID=413479 RepID=UPI00048368CF|nr:hypothetical protein [Solimonas soli]
MLTEIVTVLGPLKLVIAGVLFFNLAWLAVRKWLALGVFGISVGEVSLPQLWAQAQQFGVDLLHHPLRALDGLAPSFGGGEFVYVLLANALLAAAIWFAVRSLQLWARATVKRHEEEFWELVQRDEGPRRGGVAPARSKLPRGRFSRPR